VIFINNFVKNIIYYKKFIKNNKLLFCKGKIDNYNNKKKILIEFNAFHNAHVPLSYLSNILAKIYKSEINAFYNYSIIRTPLKNSLLNEVRWKIGNFFSIKNFGIYRSFGVKNIFKPSISSQNKIKSKLYLKKIYSKLKKKEDISKIRFDNILVGDLIYDTYLKFYTEPTVEIKDKRFYNLLRDFLSLYFFWKAYLKKNKVTAVIGVHTPYSYGLILRMAINKNIPAYATSSRFIYSLSKKMPYMHGHFKIFKKTFNKFNYSLKKKAFNLAKKKLELRFKGIGGAKVDLISNEKSSFRSKKFQRKIISSKKIKILIAPHDFFDAAHIYGSTLFVDFYEWLRFLGKLSETTEYDWYIKNRPNFNGKFKLYQPHTNNIIKDIIKEFPKLKLLPNDYSHHQIIKEKIDFVLTCYGSVGVEYPYFGVPVINASKNNPHINYNFNLHPKSINDYKILIESLKKLKNKNYKFSKNEIYEYYFMRNIYTDKSWLIENLSEMINYVGGYDGMWSNKFYEYWISKLNNKRHNEIIKTIENFLQSKESYLNIKHSGKLKNNFINKIV
jgi:hypothetical protein